MDTSLLLSNRTRPELERIASNWHQRLQRLQTNRVPGQNSRLDALITELYYPLALLTITYVSTNSNLQPLSTGSFLEAPLSLTTG